jgi:hypothetical protein
MKSSKLILGLCAALVAASAFAQATVTVYSQNPVPGDSFTNGGSTNQGQSFGNPNWVYNNTRGGGSVGIRNNYPRSGNGSVYFNSPAYWEGGYRVFCRPRERWRQLRTQSF